jgi:hypothetical protein
LIIEYYKEKKPAKEVHLHKGDLFTSDHSPFTKKILQACKPGSVSRCAGRYHLSVMAVASHLYLPTLDRGLSLRKNTGTSSP